MLKYIYQYALNFREDGSGKQNGIWKPMTEFVMIPVPSHRVLEVYALLAQDPTKAPMADQESTSGPSAEWDEAMLTRCWNESPGPVKGVLFHLSTLPDRVVSSVELAPAIHRDGQQLSGVLGAFMRRVKNRYGMNSYPFEHWWDHGINRAMYRMDTETAQAVTKIAANDRDFDPARV